MRTVIEETLGVGKISELTLHDEEGLIYGYFCDVVIDAIIRDKQHVIIEAKSRVDPGDVKIAALKAKLYQKNYGVKPCADSRGSYCRGPTRLLLGWVSRLNPL